MEKEYLLISIINSNRAYKAVKKRLKEIGYYRFTAIDTIGSTELLGQLEYSTTFAKSLAEIDDLKYNKTLMLVLPNEEEAIHVMDEIESVMKLDRNKPGKGIMFTIPIFKAVGIRKPDEE